MKDGQVHNAERMSFDPNSFVGRAREECGEYRRRVGHEYVAV